MMYAAADGSASVGSVPGSAPARASSRSSSTIDSGTRSAQSAVAKVSSAWLSVSTNEVRSRGLAGSSGR